MSEFPQLDFLSGYPGGPKQTGDREALAFQKAKDLYRKVRLVARTHNLWAFLVHRSNKLLSMPDITEATNHHYLGLKPISIDQIRGSEGRFNDFDRAFRPLKDHNKERWIRLATLVCLGVNLPPVELLQIGDIYYVRDGNHRVSVMRATGGKFIDAHVTVNKLNT